jgi:ABC-type amino acid transport substrate-binding protein
LLTTQPFLWRQCCLATGDGPSIGFLAAALGTLLADLERRTTLATAGVLIGLALASKVTTLLALPIVVALIWHYAPRPWRALGYVLAFAAVGGILGCPYLFTDPLRLAKSVVGNLFRPGEPVGMATAVQLLAEPVLRWPLLLLVAAASLIAVVGRSWTMLAGLLACLGAAVLSTTGAGIVYPRYYTSIALIAVLFTVLVSWETGASLAWRFGPRPPLRAIPAMLLAALLVFQTYLGLKELKGSPNPYSLAADDLGSLPPGTRAIVPLESLHWMVEHASSASLERMAATCEHGAIGGRSLDGFVASRYADLDGIVPILANALNEDEQAFAARVRAAAGVEDRTGIDLRVFARPCDAERLSLLTREEAVRQWRSGQVDAVVLDRPLGDEIAARRYAKGSRVVLWRYDRGAASASP